MRHITEVGMVEWLRIAKTYDGIKELVGGQLNPKVKRFFGATHFPPENITKATPWCAAFVSFCLAHAGVPSPRTANAAKCGAFGLKVEPGDEREGDIVVLAPGVTGAGTSGHVGFLERKLSAEEWLIFSGNCKNSACSHAYSVSRVVAVRRVDHR